MTNKALLEQVVLDPEGLVPVYVQLKEGLQRQIESRGLLPGHQLPTVQEISQRYGLSTSTVMRALNDLAAEGTIVTRRGARSCVAARRAPSTEIVLHFAPASYGARQMSFFQQLMDGLQEGYQDPSRRFWMTFSSTNRVSPQEMERVCAARHTDGIVAYRPQPEAMECLRSLSLEIPTCTLFDPALGGPVDQVMPSPTEALSGWVQKRLKVGQRAFSYVGTQEFLSDSRRAETPYQMIYQGLKGVLSEAGVPLMEHIVPTETFQAERSRYVQEWLPEGSAVVLWQPFALSAPEIRERNLDALSYTECRQTMEAVNEEVAVLYMGLECLGKAAAQLLQSRGKQGIRSAGRLVQVPPAVVEAHHGKEGSGSSGETAR